MSKYYFQVRYFLKLSKSLTSRKMRSPWKLALVRSIGQSHSDEIIVAHMSRAVSHSKYALDGNDDYRLWGRASSY